MNKKEQGFAIAEFCGYKPDPETNLWYGLGEDIIAGFNTHKQRIEPLPDYLGDLNAIQKAIKRIAATERYKFQNWLSIIVGRAHRMAEPTWLFITAEPEQLAEALLRTLNLWK